MKHFAPLVICFLLAAVGHTTAAAGRDFRLDDGHAVRVFMPSGLAPVAESAFGMFRSDVAQVLGTEVVAARSARRAYVVCRIDGSLPREGFRLQVRRGRLLVTGADAHGVAYGLLEVSRLMGVSPWEYWADCRPARRSAFVLPDGYCDAQSPRVAFRGIFINDEDWGLNPWATAQEPEALTCREGSIRGAIGPEVNERIFQLLLRLRANYYWPAMHEVSQPFFTIAGNREMAARYGIYMGGSHCEPMACSVAAEWAMRGEGAYDYVTNREGVLRFFAERVEEVKDQDVLYTIGMRGVHDSGMLGVKTAEDKRRYLQMAIDDQRALLADKVNADVTQVPQVPQVFIPYKEVLEIYRDGLTVPDDVTLMWTDDNYGYIRHYPDSTERARSGGNGIYYHVSYWGRPHDYLWLGTFSPTLLYRQLSDAYRRGIQRIWIVNVGDIKPSEYQIEEFLTLAWDGREPDMEAFYAREFGAALAPAIVAVMQEHYALAEQRKPEHMAGTRTEEPDRAYWNTLRAIDGWTKGDVAERVARYQAVSDAAEGLWQQVPEARRDAFFQLVKYPVQAAAQMNFKFLCPERCLEAYDSIQSLTYIYNKVCAAGKWDGIMDMQPRRLPVFGRVLPEQVPAYPDGASAAERRLHDMRFVSSADSVTLTVRLEPTHPVTDRLRFAVSVDGCEPVTCEYQTYDRSEEWKQNVLRGYAERTVRLPLSAAAEHKVTFTPLDDGVQLKEILLGEGAME